jgi:hypothetical protein
MPVQKDRIRRRSPDILPGIASLAQEPARGAIDRRLDTGCFAADASAVLFKVSNFHSLMRSRLAAW